MINRISENKEPVEQVSPAISEVNGSTHNGINRIMNGIDKTVQTAADISGSAVHTIAVGSYLFAKNVIFGPPSNN